MSNATTIPHIGMRVGHPSTQAHANANVTTRGPCSSAGRSEKEQKRKNIKSLSAVHLSHAKKNTNDSPKIQPYLDGERARDSEKKKGTERDERVRKKQIRVGSKTRQSNLPPLGNWVVRGIGVHTRGEAKRTDEGKKK